MNKTIALVADRLGPSDGTGVLVWPFLAAGVGIAALGLLFSQAFLSIAAVMAGAILVAVAVLLWAIGWLGARSQRAEVMFLADWLAHDTVPSFTTDAVGMIGFQNPAAKARFGSRDGLALKSALTDHFASPAAVLFRLQCRAEIHGAAQENVRTRRGHMRLSVHQGAPDRYLWRMEEFAEVFGDGPAGAVLPMFTLDPRGQVLFANDALRKLVGGGPRAMAEFVVSPTVPRAGEPVVVRQGAGTVTVLWAETQAAPEIRAVYLFPLAPTQANPSTSEDFEHIPIALIRFSELGRVMQCNLAARELTGMAQMDCVGIADLFEGLGRSVKEWLWDVAQERMPQGSEVLRLRNAALDTYFQVTLRRTLDQGRVSVLAVLQDATAIKTLEAQFAQSQKMQVIGQLAGGIAHDFNNLLTAISGHCDLLLLQHEPDDAEFADLVQIHQNANRAAALVGQLLGFSRKQVLMPEPIDLQEVLADLTHLLNRLVGERVSLRLIHAVGLGAIRADKRQLEQVIMNLVVNARDAMPQGGTIGIETEEVVLTQALHRDRAIVPPGRFAVVRVIDTGCGIAPDKLDRIFEPFFTTKKPGEGTGLGLSMAYGIVKQSGGFIFCDSTPGQGTTFQLFFPIQAPTHRDASVGEPTRQAVEPDRRLAGVVLLVEDEAPVRAFAARALRLRGLTVLEAENAEQALGILDDPSVVVDLFLTDVVMPGLDGPGWVRKALEIRPGARVIFVSGYAEDSLSEDCARIPNAVFLPKPFSLKELSATVATQLA